MLKTRQLQCLTPRRDWKNWDIVFELEQREGDDAPRFSYTALNFIVDWGEGTVQTVTTWSTSARDHVGPSLAPGTYIVKIKITRGENGNTSRIAFGAQNTTVSTLAKMRQLKRILKCDLSMCRTLSYFAMKCSRLESVCPITGCRNLVNLSYAFYYCINLRGTLYFDDTRAVTNASYVAGYSKIDKVVFRSGLPNATTLAIAFIVCDHLKEAYIGSISSVQSMTQIFNRCSRLEKIDMGAIPESCTNLDNAFVQVPCLVDFTMGKLPNCTTLSQTFLGCPNLRRLTIGSAPVCTTINNMCNGCSKLEEATVDFSGNSLISIYQAFYQCENLRRINGTIRLAPTGPTNSTGYTGVCYACTKLETVPSILPPSDGFTTLTLPAAQLSNNFYWCVSMNGTMPDWWWTSWPGTGNKTNCFAFCFQLDNYADIPTSYTNGVKFE